MLCPCYTQATVEEALWFSARLRLSKDIDNKRMWAFIHEVGNHNLLQQHDVPSTCLIITACVTKHYSSLRQVEAAVS